MNIYFDIDGVLAQYEREAYIGNEPKYLQRGTHYFRHCAPDLKALTLLSYLIADAKNTGNEVFILTSVNKDTLMFNEHLHDKIVWLNEWVPAIDIDHILISVSKKNDCVEYIRSRKLTLRDILIDDYNKNLRDWERAGGTAIKYLNGINSPDSFAGIQLFETDTLDEMLNKIKCGNEQ